MCFVHPAEVQGHVQLHKGHVFVAPQGLSVKNPLFITILTEDGIVQDLKLIPGGKKAAPIVLESADAAPKNSNTWSDNGRLCFREGSSRISPLWHSS